MKYPGTEGKPFYIQFDHDWLNKRDTIVTDHGISCVVTKVYKNTWWRRLLRKPFFYRLGIRVRICQVKVLKCKQ